MKLTKLFTAILLILTINHGQASEIIVGLGRTLYFDGNYAEEFFDYLTIEEKKQFVCINRVRSGAQGTAHLCRDYSDEIERLIKRFKPVNCREHLSAIGTRFHFTCQIGISDSEAFKAGKAVALKGSSHKLGKKLTQDGAGDFTSADGSLSFFCRSKQSTNHIHPKERFTCFVKKSS